MAEKLYSLDELLRQPYADLALALRLLDGMATPTPCNRYGNICQAHQQWDLTDGAPCPQAEAHELLVRHGIREA